MSDEEYPNFGNAYPTTTTAATNANESEASTAHWNPALRPDTVAQDEQGEETADVEADDDFYERYPGATPKKQQQGHSRILSTAEELENESMAARIGNAMSLNRSASAENGATVEEAQKEAMEADTGHEQTNEASVVDPEAAEDDEPAVFHAGETVAEQERDLEQMPDPEAEAGQPANVEGGEAAAESFAEGATDEQGAPEEHYDYQGGVPEMEAAQVEEPDAPLLEDEEAPPTTGQISREPTFDLDGESSPRQPASKAQAAPPHIDRSFTTNFTEMPVEQERPRETIAEEPSAEENWPAQDDDKTFGELLDHQRPQSNEEAADLASQEVAESSVDNTYQAMLGDHEQQELPQTRPTTQDWPGDDEDDDFNEMLGGQQESVPEHAAEADAANQGLGDVSAPDGMAVPAAGGEEENWAALLGDDDELLGDDDELLPDEDDVLNDGADKHDPSKLFGDQDDLLEDEPFLSESQPQQQVPQQSQQQPRNATSGQYRPANASTSQTPQQSPYVAQSPFIQQNHGRSAGTPDTGLFDIYNTQPAPAQQQQQPQRPGLQTAQSFVDKSKSGYQAYGDLPMEVVKPRRRPAQQPAQSAMPQPPPRTSSFGTPNASAPPTPQMAQGLPGAPKAPPTQLNGSDVPAPPRPNGSASAKSTPSTDSGFFADLPMKPKLRARPSGVFTPQTPGTPAPPPGPMGPPQAHPSRAQAPPVQPPQRSAQPPAPQQQPMYGGLRQPDRMPLLPDEQATPAQQQPLPGPSAQVRYSPGLAPAQQPTQSRYSPAPAATTTAPAASRYSPAPGAQPGSGPRRQPSSGPGVGAAVHPFAPRTSSPLAYAADKPQPPLPAEAARSTTMSPPRSNGAPPTTAGSSSPERKAPSRYSPAASSGSVPASGSLYGAGVMSPPQPPPTAPPASGGPPRPRTQSPGATIQQPRYAMTSVDRPTSAAGIPTMQSFNSAQQQQAAPRSVTGPALPHRRQISREIDFAAPQDERSQDPLERWKGQPIFNWGPSGAIVYTFPKVTPFWGGAPGQASVKSTPGQITLTDAASFQPMDDRNAKFPGPLPIKGKGKKKDVLAWMSGKIEDLERQVEGARLNFDLATDLKRRAEEKLILWKIARIFVEHDGMLEGNPKIEEEVRKILLPNLADMSQVAELQSPVSASAISADPVDKAVLLQLRQALLEGQRERAVWLAEEKKLWGHAMLIASTMGPDVWKQIIQSFVRNQVKIVGSDARSLAALYQTFAGNAEESVDELVPPSARAGFQMISKSDGSVSGNPMEGLEQWRETLGLVVGNRTPSDGPSLLALGKLLMSYGRAEAASTCFLFARAFAKHGGADDAEATFVLLGANHQSPEESLGSDLDTILLTEIYEWASSLSTQPATANYVPHLQSYKLIHANVLAGFGLKTKAQAYCDHIEQAYKHTTRPSQYYHPAFTQAVADLQGFLAQAPKDGKGGIFGRPAMNKVSSGAASWFNKFVAGGDDDVPQDGTVQGQPADEGGPFGRLSGEMSRTGSSADIYGSVMMGGNMPMTPGSQGTPSYMASPPQVSGGAGGRYAPGGAATQRAGLGAPFSPEANNGIAMAPQQQRPVVAARAASARYAPAATSALSSGLGVQGVQGLDVPRPEASRAASDYSAIYNGGSRRGSAQTSSSQGSYNPTPSLAQEPSPYAYQSSPLVQPYQSAEPDEEQDAFDTSKPAEPTMPDYGNGVEDAEGGISGGGGFQPIGGSTGYEPPSYQAYEPEPEPEEDEAPKPKKKSMMDFDDNNDDDDALARQAAALKKAQADREADDAFRKAAEADAARDNAKNEGKKSGSWLGGWFGGKKDQAADLNKPIRAKLGEENSFVYDEALGKWVNKKAGAADSATPAAATPPPPMRGPPSASGVASRAVSGSMPPPSGPPSRVASAVGAKPMGPPMGVGLSSGPPSRAGTPASLRSGSGAEGAGEGVAGGLAPPSRPGTGMSGASSLDDLLGAPGPRKGGAGATKGKKKGGRYVDVMAK